ncbi:MAG: hypothetical protein ABI591_20780 [Kofleriaceae bacterium]
MAGANLYDLHGNGKRILFYPLGKGPIPAGEKPGPTLIYDDGSTQVECRGAKLKVGHESWAGTAVTALVRDNGIVPGAVTSLVVMIPDVVPPPADGSVPVHTIAILSNHRGIPQIGPGQLETYSEFAVTGIAALTKLPL